MATKQNDNFYGKLVKPAIIGGAWTGVGGLAIGGIFGAFRSKTPVAYTAASGIEAFGVGTILLLIRDGFLTNRTFGEDRHAPRTRLKASGAAGALAGAFRGAITGDPRGVLAGSLIYGSLGFGGQKMYNVIDGWHSRRLAKAEVVHDRPQETGLWRIVDWMADYRYSPLQRMSDREYEERLQEQLLGVEANLAILDDRIEKAKQQLLQDSAKDGPTSEK